MLKKLSKYGNSTTLVIDKAILELLNMNESSIVKLHTDGTSLTITPVKSKGDQKVSYETFEALAQAKESKIKSMIPKEIPANSKVQDEFSIIFKKHKKALTRFNTEILPSKDFQEALALIADKFDPVEQSAEYVKEFNKLKIQFCPELEHMQKEIDITLKKHS